MHLAGGQASPFGNPLRSRYWARPGRHVGLVKSAIESSRGSDPRPLDLTMGWLLDPHWGATPCIKDCPSPRVRPSLKLFGLKNHSSGLDYPPRLRGRRRHEVPEMNTREFNLLCIAQNTEKISDRRPWQPQRITCLLWFVPDAAR